MPDLAQLIASGSANAWIYLPVAVLLGALHGLEPGHSKSMMGAFIIAVRGTVPHAMLLGLCAAISHSFTVAVVALVGLYFGDKLIADKAEHYLMIVSGMIIIGMALWMMRRAWPRHARDSDYHHDHEHDDHHNHHHDEMDNDAHAAMHAHEIATKFSTGTATNWQVAMFGLTGGLLPCPASITVLMIALQLRAFTLGAAMVAAFSLGLALTLMSVGVVAAWGVRHAEKHMSNFAKWFKILPLASSALMLCIGGFMLWQGLAG